ncbi:MAG: class I SAM-dependent methyltransferase [Acidobacteriaceae bacterium]|nr:class I SAM-dependent methyltransferase [Acidobacteriaceae bacterium]
MRFQGQAKLGFFPLPPSEAVRLKRWLSLPERFSALDPCVGDGAAFATLLEFSNGLWYGIEIDAHRSAQAQALGIEVLHANTLDVRCDAESVSLMYLNPPYDWEYGHGKNERLESIFLQHSYRWLKCEGVLVLVIPQPRIQPCARLLAEHFRDIRVYRLTAAESVRFKQVAILAVRRRRHDRLRDAALSEMTRYLERVALQDQIPELQELPEAAYKVPCSGPILLTNTGLPLDQIEDQLPQSPAYRQATRVLIREQRDVGGRPLTPLHGGHVGLLCTAGMLNGVFGKDELLHIAHWKSVKFTDHWEEEEEDGAIIVHDRERFSHELTLIFADGRTQILTHEKQSPPC